MMIQLYIKTKIKSILCIDGDDFVTTFVIIIFIVKTSYRNSIFWIKIHSDTEFKGRIILFKKFNYIIRVGGEKIHAIQNKLTTILLKTYFLQ